MSNPWLSIPLSDYEGHMNSPEVRQLDVLADLFAEALKQRRPASVAVLGVAGGNGLDRIDPRVTKRVVGIDVNPAYLKSVQQRYGALLHLELECADLAATAARVKPVDLVHAALIFEHAGVDGCFENAVALLNDGGTLSVVLQLPSESAGAVAATGFASIQTLHSHFAFVDPATIQKRLSARGLRCTYECERTLPGAKRFWMGMFAS